MGGLFRREREDGGRMESRGERREERGKSSQIQINTVKHFRPKNARFLFMFFFLVVMMLTATHKPSGLFQSSR